jgi:hypothetical protein
MTMPNSSVVSEGISSSEAPGAFSKLMRWSTSFFSSAGPRGSTGAGRLRQPGICLSHSARTKTLAVTGGSEANDTISFSFSLFGKAKEVGIDCRKIGFEIQPPDELLAGSEKEVGAAPVKVV